MQIFVTILGMLFGVFDGHGGAACAQVISKRLYKYIAACLLPGDALNRYYQSLITKDNGKLELIQTYNDKVQFVDDIREIYNNSFLEFITELNKVSVFPYKNFAKFSYLVNFISH